MGGGGIEEACDLPENKGGGMGILGPPPRPIETGGGGGGGGGTSGEAFGSGGGGGGAFPGVATLIGLITIEPSMILRGVILFPVSSSRILDSRVTCL